MAGRKPNLDLAWKKLMKLVDLGEPTSFLDPNESIIEAYKKMFESRISAGATESYVVGKHRTRKQSRGLTI